MNLNANCKKELEFIKLGLEIEHYAHFRHFVDQYFCFANGYITKNNKASWSKIAFNEWVSYRAKGKSLKEVVHKEHVVPLNVIKEKLKYLKERGNLSIHSIRELLDDCLIFATITKEEDKLLRSAGLNSSMPIGYGVKGHKYENDNFARYNHIGISVFDVKQR